MRSSQKGFSPVEIIIVVVVVGVMGALGYVAYNRFATPSDDVAKTAQVEKEVSTKIKSTDDIDKVSKELDGISFDNEADNSTLDTAAKAF